VKTYKLSLVCVLAIGCDDNKVCADVPEVVLTSVVPDYFNADSLALTGAIANADCYIEDVRVCGVPVTAKRDNFAAWEVTLTREQVSGCGPVEGLAYQRTIDIDVTMANEVVTSFAAATVNLEVPGLGVSATSTSCHVPADKSEGLGFVITADSAAVGAKVNVSSTLGDIVGVDADKNVTLRKDGGQAAAYVTVFADKPGALVVKAAPATGSSASSEQRWAVATPVIFPAGGTVPRGAEVEFQVSTRGELSRCTIFETLPDASTVLLKGTPKEASEFVWPATTPDCTVPPTTETKTFTLLFAADAPKGVSVQVRCEDRYPSLAAVVAFTVADP